jgi:D-3-phosphoglycerate dehydrogenase
MAERLRILTINHISGSGLARLPAARYLAGPGVDRPDAILVRSADLHKAEIPASVRAIGRAGAGTNNIPVAAMSRRGVPVFNAPGANANAVKELVIAGLLMAARNVVPALSFVASLADRAEAADDAGLDALVEAGKKDYAGYELAGRTLGVIGLGRIGRLVAEAALALGMDVLGHDPEITVDAAWSLPATVRRASSVEQVLRASEFVTLHVPLVDATRHLIDATRLATMRRGAVLANFAREAIVDAAAVRAALDSGQLHAYLSDFPSRALFGHPRAVALPHLGASTREAEDNCAVMVVDQLRDFLEHGNIRNAVNFPDVSMAREAPYRLGIANANVPNMLGQISTALARAGLNIHNMINKSRAEMAYTLVDVDSAVSAPTCDELAAIDGVLAVRYLPVPGE